MERQLHGLQNQPATLTQLQQTLVRIWNDIPQAFFNRLVPSMRRCCKACANANGGHNRYWAVNWHSSFWRHVLPLVCRFHVYQTLNTDMTKQCDVFVLILYGGFALRSFWKERKRERVRVWDFSGFRHIPSVLPVCDFCQILRRGERLLPCLSEGCGMSWQRVESSAKR